MRHNESVQKNTMRRMEDLARIFCEANNVHPSSIPEIIFPKKDTTIFQQNNSINYDFVEWATNLTIHGRMCVFEGGDMDYVANDLNF